MLYKQTACFITAFKLRLLMHCALCVHFSEFNTGVWYAIVWYFQDSRQEISPCNLVVDGFVVLMMFQLLDSNVYACCGVRVVKEMD